MIRGTTPTLSFTLPFIPIAAEKIWITFEQNDVEVFTLEKHEITIEDNVISFTLTQEQTLALLPNSIVQIQIRIKFSELNVIASDTITTTVKEILKDGVM